MLPTTLAPRLPEAGPILVGLDFSPSAVDALAVARRMAAAFGTHLDPVHVLEDRDAPAWGDDAGIGRWLIQARLREDAVTVRCGLPWVELARRAQAVKPTMVIVGSHGHAGHQPVALGSTAQRLALISPVPVLIVRAGREATGLPGPPAARAASNRLFMPPTNRGNVQ